jgi:ribosome-associated protein
MDDILIHSDLVIPAGCLKLSYSRSSGPGGQNVNKLNTRVSISLNISECVVFSDAQKSRLVKALHRRLDQEGVLTVVCQEHRSQYANRQAAAERMVDLLRAALKPPRPRIKTRTPKSAIQKRLEAKKKRSQVKQDRRQKYEDS